MDWKRAAMAGLAVLAAGVVVGDGAAAGQASTTRIEPRPFYGAVITLEEGVRVFRPLPRLRHMIINPGHRTPLNLTIEERREVSRNYHYYQGGGGESGASTGGASGGLPYGFGGDHGGRGVRHKARSVGGIGVQSFRGYRSAKGHASRGHHGGRRGKGH